MEKRLGCFVLRRQHECSKFTLSCSKNALKIIPKNRQNSARFAADYVFTGRCLDRRDLYRHTCRRRGIHRSAVPSYVIQAEIQNLVAGMLNKFSADLERSVRGSQYLKVTATGMPTAHVPQLRAITDLAEAEVLCCETKIKLEFSEAASLFYCPFCGQAQV